VHDQVLTPSGGRCWLRPTRGALAVVPAAVAVELVGRLVNSDWVTLAAAGLIGALVAAALLTSNPRAVIITRSAPLRLRVDEPAIFRLTASNKRRWRSVGPLVVVDKTPGLPEAALFVRRLSPGATAVADLVRTPTRRGRWTAAGTISIDARSPLGGFARRRTWTWTTPTIVHPAPANRLRLTAGPSPTHGSRRGADGPGRGIEVFGLRDWRPGDGAAAVHWRTSARRRSLSVVERERPAAQVLIVALARQGDGAAWELAVARTAATAAMAFHGGSRVMLVSGAGVTVPPSLTALLDWFADVEVNPVASRSQVLKLAADGGAPVIWLVDEENA
jgi:uncharacterized protein (DUF58 family)